MPSLRPDPTFYPSPGMAMQAPPERLAYVALLNVGTNGQPDAHGRRRPRSGVGHATASSSAGWISPTAATSCTTSAGTPAARASARTRRTRTWSGATWSCRASRSSRIHILDTKPDPRSPKLVKVIEPDEVIAKTGYSRAAHDPLRPRRHLRERARLARAATARAASSSSTPRRSSCKGRGSRTAARSTSPTTSGGTWATTP